MNTEREFDCKEKIVRAAQLSACSPDCSAEVAASANQSEDACAVPIQPRIEPPGFTKAVYLLGAFPVLNGRFFPVAHQQIARVKSEPGCGVFEHRSRA